MLYCNDCRHLTRGYSRPLCFARKETEEDIVNGRYFKVRTAREARTDPTLCGIDAKWFEPKRSLWRWLFNN